jgi:hypothetical protein
MSYSKFSLPDAVKQFQLTLTDREDLFPAVQDATVSSYLEVVRERLFPLGVAIGSEKARSEFIIAPLLVEVRGQSPTPVSLFSGIDFTVDQTQGLNGFCDFLLSRSEQQFFVDAPVLAIIEAKDENIRGGLGQCAATMVGAQLFNEREGKAVTEVYGAVTTGDVWRFLRLRGKQLAIDREERFLKPVERLLGILREIVSAPPGVP